MSATNQFLRKVCVGQIEEVEGVYSFGDSATSFVNHQVLATKTFDIAIRAGENYAKRVQNDVEGLKYQPIEHRKPSVDFSPFSELKIAVEFGLQTSQLLDHEDTRILLALYEALSAFIETIGSISDDRSEVGVWHESDFQSIEIFCDLASRSVLEAAVYIQKKSTRFEERNAYLDRVTRGRTSNRAS